VAVRLGKRIIFVDNRITEMRYIGSKQKLLGDIHKVIQEPEGSIMLDAFCGSGVVAESFAVRYKVVACDLMHVCQVVTAARLMTRSKLSSTIDETIEALNTLEGVDGFVYNTFTPAGGRKYFSEENGKKIDAIVRAIHEETREPSDRTFLLGCLVESISLIANTSGTYGSFNKKWDPRALNPLVMKNHFTLTTGGSAHVGDAANMVRDTAHDILYLDPPYNKRQYGGYYHVLETIVRNDNPVVHGTTGIRDWKDTKSKFCNKDTAEAELRKLLSLTSARVVVMSYNNEGLLSRVEIEAILSVFGNVVCHDVAHTRYNAGRSTTGNTIEYLFVSQKHVPQTAPASYENMIFNEDCIVGMQRLPSASVDMILTDLPYGLTECRWDSVIPLDKLWEQYKRVIKPSGAIVLFGQQPFTATLVCSNQEMFKYSLIWKKTKTGNFAQAPYRFLCEHEDILVFSFGKTAKNGKPRMVYNPQGTRPCHKVMKGKTGTSEHRENRETQADYVQTVTNYPRSVLEFANEGKPLHPTQKPTGLCEYLIRTFTNERDIVLDSCMGAGTTAIASRNTNRKFVGFEMDADNYLLCIERLGKLAIGI
jgi:site-specific DNA-methyltransferase (adenine-specific)